MWALVCTRRSSGLDPSQELQGHQQQVRQLQELLLSKREGMKQLFYVTVGLWECDLNPRDEAQ